MNIRSADWHAIKVLFLLVLAAGVSACSGDDELSPEDEILAQIEVMEVAAQERRVGDLMDFVASNYTDNKSLTHDKIKRLLRIRFIQQKSIHVFTKVTSIDTRTGKDDSATDTMAGMHANVVVYAGVARAPFESIAELADLGEMAVDMLRFNLQLQRRDDRWIILSSTWHRASLTDLF